MELIDKRENGWWIRRSVEKNGIREESKRVEQLFNEPCTVLADGEKRD